MDRRLENKVIFVSGSTAGIGAAMARQFAREGARVVITGRTATKGEALAAEIKAAGGEALYARLDISDEESVKSAVAAAVSAYGRLDGVVNNAAMVQGRHAIDGPVTEITLENWEYMLRTNLTGAFLVSKYTIPHLVSGGGGSVVHIASTAAMSGRPGIDGYTAAKGGMVSLTRSMAYYYARYRTRVNCIVVGFVDTGEPSIKAMLEDPQFGPMIRRYYLGRIGRPIDVAYSAAHLLSDQAEWITGSVMAVDGGATGVSHMERRVPDMPGFPTDWNDFA